VFFALVAAPVSLDKNSFPARTTKSVKVWITRNHTNESTSCQRLGFLGLRWYSCTGSVKKKGSAKGWPCEMYRSEKDSSVTRRDLTESEVETRCIRAWRKSEVLKNQEAESNERQYQEITSRGGGPTTLLFTLSRLRKERFADSLIAIRELK